MGALKRSTKPYYDLFDDEWGSRTNHSSPPPKQLMFVHFEKSGGAYSDFSLRGALGEDKYMSFHRPEGQAATDVAEDYFLVANIRNPCSQAISAWEFLCEAGNFLLQKGQTSMESEGGLELIAEGK